MTQQVINLKGRSLCSLIKDYTVDEVKYLVNLSLAVKAHKKDGNLQKEWLNGKNIVTLWEKDSTRTRCSFDVASFDLGMCVTYIGPQGSNYGKKESIEDTALVLGKFYDGIQFRGFSQKNVEILSRLSTVPVWNGLTNDEHPTQIIADLMTMVEEMPNKTFDELKGKKFIFIGDYKNNMGHSEAIACAFAGMHCILCGPDDYQSMMIPEIIDKVNEINKITGGSLTFCNDKIIAAKNANFIYTDVWVSLGEPFELFDKRIGELKDFQVDMNMINSANNDVKFLHCLPSFHDNKTSFAQEVSKTLSEKYPLVKNGEIEVTDEVFQSKHSIVFREAENRMHSIKAIMLATLANSEDIKNWLHTYLIK
ncbi:MAG: ornithine carbamoyltransferase [Mycoplasma sp.]